MGGGIAVIGVGNEFRRDDGVGWAVVGRLRERAEQHPLPPRTAPCVCDGDPVRLIGAWEDADLAVVVDAAHAHPARPGLVHRLELDARELTGRPAVSSYGLVLGEAIELVCVLGRLLSSLVVYAVEGADTSLGSGLSDVVAAVVAPLSEDVEAEIARHRAYRDLETRFSGLFTGVVVQPLAARGTELFTGVVQDDVFGPLVLFGFGGTATEVLADHAARLAPLTDHDVHGLITTPRCAPLLFGLNGTGAVDLEGLEQLLHGLSLMATGLPQLAEADLNPVIARPGGITPVDVRIRLTPRHPKDPYLRRLR